MSKHAAFEFLERAESDANIRAELDAIEAKSRAEALERVVGVGARHGHAFTGEALAEAIRDFMSCRLDDDDLDRVAGGRLSSLNLFQGPLKNDGTPGPDS